MKLTHNEIIKEAIPTLAGTIAATLADPAVVPHLAGKAVKKVVVARGRLVSVVVG